MKPAHVRFISIFACLCLIICIVAITRTELHGADEYPLLYYNDRAWPTDRPQAECIRQRIWYVPLNLFAQFPNLNVRTNTNGETFCIQNGEKFLTFEIATGFAADQDRNRMYLMTYEMYGDYYVPVEAVCQLLDLGYETCTSTVTGETAIRITNGSQQYTFEELLRRKYPGFFEPETTQPPETETTADTTEPVTETTPPDSETDEPIPQLPERTIYITIEDAPGEYTGDILDVLDEFGYKATFFVIGEQAAQNPELLSRIAAGGHSIGLHTMSHDVSALTDPEAILADIEAENELLSCLIKQKSHIWRAPEGSDGLAALDSICEVELNHRGYLIWDFNIDAGGARSAAKAVEKVINGIWLYDKPIIRICESGDAAAILRGVLEFIADNRDVCEVRTIMPAYYEYSLVR